ncbi:class I adenylate-forming enzyme family protein [Natronorarus salvus]|uniref:class I adenylate-forming enzyme family protein n=1 Tax=Natronorarus salvus TaxID=3117733 RepID=UPI002F2633D3
MNDSTLRTTLSEVAARTPDREALVDPRAGERRSFVDLDRRASDLAAGLADQGMERGDRLTVLVGDSVEFLELLFACAHAGIVCNPISTRVAPDRLAYVLDHAGSTGVVVDRHGIGTLRTLEAEDRPPVSIGVGAGNESPVDHTYDSLFGERAADPAPIAEDDPALLLYTSGTTGRPKGVVHTHRNVVDAALVCLPYNRFRPTDVNLALGPLYHVGPLLCNVLPAFSVGATNVIRHGFDPTATLDLIESEGITAMWGVPTHVRALVDEGSIGERDLGSVRMIQYSGSAMPASVAHRCREHMPDCAFVNAYGTTEMVFGTILFPEFHDGKLGSIGRAVPKATVRVVDPDESDPEATCEPGEVGELLIRNATTMTEYWRDPEATEETFVDGWYRSGDLVRRDEEGFLYFVDRTDDMIVTGGENVYPAEVEDVLHSHPGVVTGAVVGVPDGRWGEVVTAVVVPRDEGLSAEELEGFFLDSSAIESFKRPRRYVFRESLPTTASDKIDRRTLLDSITDG